MIKIIKYQLYILQLENYQYFRFLRVLKKSGFTPPKTGLRHNLVWTAKAKLLMLITIGIHVGLLMALQNAFDLNSSWMDILFLLVIFLLLGLGYYLWFGIVLIIIWPIDYIIKSLVVTKAHNKLRNIEGLRIIGIAGSYGKTTMKEALKSVLEENFNTLAVPDSVNTPIGIARFISRRVTVDTEILILELGEHYQGDIRGLCKMFPPDIGVITGINESHLERLGKIEITIQTIFELAGGIKKNGFLILNSDDEHVQKNYKKFIGNYETYFYSSKNGEVSEYKVKDYVFDEEKLTNTFNLWKGNIKIGEFRTKLLGEYVLGVVQSVVILARKLEMPIEKIERGVANLLPVEHRLEPIVNSSQNILIIDDSYNGNPEGVSEAIKLLGKFKKRRKIYLTPGLVETGERVSQIHNQIGKQLSKTADMVLLIKNSVTQYILLGLKENNFEQKNIIQFPDAKTAHDSLGSILKPGDVILFQNDWGDQYQ